MTTTLVMSGLVQTERVVVPQPSFQIFVVCFQLHKELSTQEHCHQ